MPLTLSVLTYRNQPPSRPIEHTFSGAGGTIGRESQNDLMLTDPGRVISRKQAQIQCLDNVSAHESGAKSDRSEWTPGRPERDGNPGGRGPAERGRLLCRRGDRRG
jgi:hypothetical protein